MFVKFITPVLLLTTTVHAQTVSPVVGHIEKWSCPQTHYQLNGKPDMGFYTKVRQGDQISLDPTQVTLEFQEEATGSLVKVTYKELPYTVKSAMSLVKSIDHCGLNSYRLKRKPDSLSLSAEAPLQAGDMIELAPGQPALTIRGSSRIVVKYSELPYTVSLTQTVPTLTGNLWNWLTAWFTAQHEQQRAETTMLGTRAVTLNTSQDPTPYIKLLESPTPQQVIAGRRVLTFTWKQGQPPFTLTMTGHRKQLIRKPQISGQQYRHQQQVSLTPGEYHISLRSRAGKQEYPLLVVSTKELPRYPDELLKLPDKPLQGVLKAAWLAGQEGKKWQFEAYQQVMDLLAKYEDYSPAQTLKEALLRGEVPVVETNSP